MKIFRSVLFIAVCLLAGSAAYAQVTLAENGPDRRAFTIVDSRNVAAICYDSKDAAVVKTAAELLRSDIEKVTDVQPALFDSKDAVSGAKYAIIAGTVGSSAWIDSLTEKEKIDVSAIKGGWETDPAELRVLMDKVQSGEIQYCPHGRPVKVKLTRYEIEKMFKRA